jgi:hypothetical protein
MTDLVTLGPNSVGDLFEDSDDEEVQQPEALELADAASFRARAAETYKLYDEQYRSRFKWLRPDLFAPLLKKDLDADCVRLLDILKDCGKWEPTKDAKLASLVNLLTKEHAAAKILVFSQFADTVRYLARQLKAQGLTSLAAVTGQSADPTAIAWRFSPVSNDRRGMIAAADELRVLVTTDVLSEGQNLQDGAHGRRPTTRCGPCRNSKARTRSISRSAAMRLGSRAANCWRPSPASSWRKCSGRY